MPKLSEETDKISPGLVKSVLDRLWKLGERYVAMRTDPGFSPRLQMAFLYTTRTGLMKTFGSSALVRCLEENQLKFSEAPDWENIDVMLQDDMELKTLPKLEKQMSAFTVEELSVS